MDRVLANADCKKNCSQSFVCQSHPRLQEAMLFHKRLQTGISKTCKATARAGDLLLCFQDAYDVQEEHWVLVALQFVKPGISVFVILDKAEGPEGDEQLVLVEAGHALAIELSLPFVANLLLRRGSWEVAVWDFTHIAPHVIQRRGKEKLLLEFEAQLETGNNCGSRRGCAHTTVCDVLLRRQ